MGVFNLPSPIRLNHVGDVKNARKVFVYKGEASDFTVRVFLDCRAYDVNIGRTVPMEFSVIDEGCTVGDFSALTDEGIYDIVCGGTVSFAFIIYDGVYDTVCRAITGFFTWQRCGDETGWAGKCHPSSTLVTKYGETVKISGGFHQSCDLRK